MAELKTRILVVDDDQRLRDLLVKYLSGEGYDVRSVPDCARHGQAARPRAYDSWCSTHAAGETASPSAGACPRPAEPARDHHAHG